MKLEEAERDLIQAQRILAHAHRYQPEEWMLLATLVGEADLTIRQEALASPHLKALLEEVVADFREVTNDFTNPDFLRAPELPDVATRSFSPAEPNVRNGSKAEISASQFAGSWRGVQNAVEG